MIMPYISKGFSIFTMVSTEYIEYCEEESKTEIKPEDDENELSRNRKFSEYFEEDVKEEIKDEVKMEIKGGDENTELSPKRKFSGYFEEDRKEEIVDEKEPHSNLVKHSCNICSKRYKSKKYLKKTCSFDA